MTNILIHPGIILILFGLLTLALPKKLTKITALAGELVAIYLLASLAKGQTLILPFGPWLTLSLLKVDQLSLIFCWVFVAVWALAQIYGFKIMKKSEYVAAQVYAGSTIAVTLAADWLTLLMFWEIMAVGSLMLIWLNRTEASKRASFRYLMAHLFGGNMLMIGVVMLTFSAGTGNFAAIGQLLPSDGAVFWLVTIGIFVNGAVPPLHFWIADGYPETTLTGGLILSSYTTKAAVYLMIRVLAGSGEFIIWTGIAMAILGAVFALMENDLRRLLSYHIVSQLGMMVASLGVGSALGMDGATVHAINNIVYKGVLFMAAGALIFATGKRKITDLAKIPDLHYSVLFKCASRQSDSGFQSNSAGRIGSSYPAHSGNHTGSPGRASFCSPTKTSPQRGLAVTGVCFFVAALAIAGLPGLNGFAGKSVITAAFHAEHMELESVLLAVAGVGTLLSITLKITYFVFVKKREVTVGDSNSDLDLGAGGLDSLRKIPTSMLLAMVIGTAGCVVFGVAPDLLFGWLPYGSGSLAHPFTVEHILEYVAIFAGGIGAFVLMRDILEPHDTLTLDVDWLFRRLGAFLVTEFARAVAMMCADVQEFVDFSGKHWKAFMNNPRGETNKILDYLDTPLTRKLPRFNADRDVPVGTMIIWSLAVLVVAFGLAYFGMEIRF